MFKGLGLGMAIVGFLLLWFGWSYITYLISVVFIPVGVIMFIVSSSGRSSDSDIDNDVKRKTEGLEKDLGEDKKYSRKILKHIPPETVGGYEYEEGLMLTKAKNGSVRSSEYTKAVIYILSDCLYIPRRTVSLVSEDVRDTLFEIPYEMIKGVEITREDKMLTFGKRTFNVKKTRLVISYGDGLTFSAPIHDDVNADALVDKITRISKGEI